MQKFSIIIPVYNAEKTLNQCLDSLRCQNDSNFEVLMIENGSMDSSCSICREYVALDKRFYLYTCEANYGPSGARNIGLEQASGEIITFLDSDDFVEPDYLYTLRFAFEDADVVFFGYRQISKDGVFLEEHIFKGPEGSNYYEKLLQLSRQDMFGYTWIKAFRREIIGDYRFSMELNLMEDEVFACEILAKPRKISILPNAIYNYVTGNVSSLIGCTHSDYCRKVDVVYRAWKNLLKDYDKKKEVLAEMANIYVSRCMYYGFEREIDVKDFFEYLSDSDFFKESNLSDNFCICVKNKDFKKLSHMRNSYRLKNKIARLLKR